MAIPLTPAINNAEPRYHHLLVLLSLPTPPPSFLSTIVVPLVPVTLTNGPTQLLVGSHLWSLPPSTSGLLPSLRSLLLSAPLLSRLSVSLVASSIIIPPCPSFFFLPEERCSPPTGGRGNPGGALVRPVLPLGSALLFDGRLLHRGLGNEEPEGGEGGDDNTRRSIFIIRFDFEDRPPPGKENIVKRLPGLQGGA